MGEPLTPSRVDAALVAARAETLGFYSPYHFLPGLAPGPQQARFGTGRALAFGAIAPEEVWPMRGAAGQWLLAALPWDSAYFDTPTYRLFTGLFGADVSAADLATAARNLQHTLSERGPFYTFSVVPAEDTALFQALTAGGWRLVETRLTYYRAVPAPTEMLPPFAVRLARPEEAAAIGRIAAAARNPYDRVHADAWFGPARADAYLAHYAEAAVAGRLADAVLLPDEPGLPVDSFLAVDDLRADAAALTTSCSRVLLTAVGPANRGWHLRLVAATLHRAAELGHAHVLMTTQATNRAVFRTSEKLGFRLGAVSHVVACHHGA